MGRRAWSTRGTVEDSIALGIRDLGLSGALDRKNFIGSLSWQLPFERVFGVNYRLDYGFRMDECGLILCVAPDPIWQSTLLVAQEIPIKQTKCNFGGRRFWFLCPGVDRELGGDMYHQPCGRQCTKVYFPDDAGAFACRLCHDLTYESVQQHDKRIDRLLKNPDLISDMLGSRKIRERLLAVSAHIEQIRRLNHRKRVNW